MANAQLDQGSSSSILTYVLICVMRIGMRPCVYAHMYKYMRTCTCYLSHERQHDPPPLPRKATMTTPSRRFAKGSRWTLKTRNSASLSASLRYPMPPSHPPLFWGAVLLGARRAAIDSYSYFSFSGKVPGGLAKKSNVFFFWLETRMGTTSHGVGGGTNECDPAFFSGPNLFRMLRCPCF